MTDARIGKYRLVRVISSGGMGIVYEALQEHPGRTVAIKVMKEGIASCTALKRFEYESQVMARLRHPGIAQVIEAGTHADGDPGAGENRAGLPYIVMEYIPEARTITEYARDNTAGIRQRLELFLQACDAVHHGHQRGILHRDLKPGNILVDASGQVKIIDFGVARSLDTDLALTTIQTEAGGLIGTVQYMSPEQCAGDPHDLDIRSDVYALGVVLYEVLCGELPYNVQETTVFDAARVICEKKPGKPGALNRSLRGDVETILLKALEKERDLRYQSVADLESDIRRHLRGLVIHARPAGPAVRIRKLIKRNPVVSAAIAVLLAALAALFLSIPAYLSRLTDERDKALAAENNAVEGTEEARIQTTLARKRYEEIIRLADIKRLSELEEEGLEDLWPAHPEKVGEMKEWLGEAALVMDRLPLHRRTLESLREKAPPLDPVTARRDREKHPLWIELKQYENHRENHYALLAEKNIEVPGLLKQQLFEIEDRLIFLEDQVNARHTWTFQDHQNQWEHDILANLVGKIEAFCSEEDGIIGRIEDRILLAQTIHTETIEGHEKEWRQAIVSIASEEECPWYKGYIIEPRVGLIPIGRDQDSGLWEFAHYQTGELPQRGEDGKIRMDENSALVFVLLPGGVFDMGAVLPTKENPFGTPNVDPGARPQERPVHVVNIRPLFLSKYEMTQGQWIRITGENPSTYQPGQIVADNMHTLLHPVEQVSWEDCERTLARLGLRLPAEAEWEYAARGGTTTVWWTGDEKQSLGGGEKLSIAANILDQCAKIHHDTKEKTFEEWLDDGFYVHAPVGTFRANPFGLQDVYGNVWEFTQDAGHGNYEGAPADGSPWEETGARIRVMRGGGFDYPATHCRSSHRSGSLVDYRASSVGVRPAMSVKINRDR